MANHLPTREFQSHPVNFSIGLRQIVRALQASTNRMSVMLEEYGQLLDATIHHLQELKSQGVRFIAASPETLAALDEKIQPRAAAPVKAPASSVPIQRRETPAPAPVKAAPKDSEAQSEPELLPDSANRPSPAPALSPEAKVAAFAELQSRVMTCVKCAHLASSRRNVVFGVGNINADLMFVGEAPGADEDEQGEPFVGKAGQLLTKIIQTMGLQRGDVYIANILKCRPDTPGQKAGNRKPTTDEMADVHSVSARAD